MKNETAVFRQIAFPLSAFDYLKQFQREHAARTGQRITNSEALALILKQHGAMFSEQRVQKHEQPKATRV